MGSRGPQPPARSTDGHQVSDTSPLRATSRQLQWGRASLPTISGVWLMSAVRAAVSTTMWATVMGSSGPAAAGTTYQCGTRDRGDSSGGLQSCLGLVSTGLGFCPCRMAGGGGSQLRQQNHSEPNSQPGPGGQPHHPNASGYWGAQSTKHPWEGLQEEVTRAPAPKPTSPNQESGTRAWGCGAGDIPGGEGQSETTLGPLCSGPLPVVT